MFGNLSNLEIIQKMIEVLLNSCGHTVKKGYHRHGEKGREYRLDNGLRVLMGILNEGPKTQVVLTIATRSSPRAKKKIKSGQKLFSILITANTLSIRTVTHERIKDGAGTIPVDYNFYKGLAVFMEMQVALNTFMSNDVFKIDLSKYGKRERQPKP